MSAAAVDVHRSVEERLAGAGQRYTTNRRAVVDVLVAAASPVTLPQILERGPNLPQSSTYRSLSVLEEAGAVRRVVTGGEFAYFELAEDLTEHHHHLVCESCGSVSDFALPPAVEEALDEALRRAAREERFAPRHHSLDLVGRCAACH
jgi:Fe2+ or Zn2+ uptake regulation protein